MSTDLDKFIELFSGHTGAYGTYVINGTETKRSGTTKVVGKATTIKEEITADRWNMHLSGKESLGIVPINENNECRWGCIDIDDYTIDHSALAKRISSLPFVHCRTKSGGAHLFLFTKEQVPARAMRDKLCELAAVLGFASHEKFPKQIELLHSEGDAGTWLNLPYFNGDNTDRYALLNNTPLPLSQFVDYAMSRRVSLSELENISFKLVNPVTDMPPCLEALVQEGEVVDYRNETLFNLGVYCRKKYDDSQQWKSAVREYNTNLISPSLTFEEVENTIKSLDKRTYRYKCKSIPIINYCNSTVCRIRKYGVGCGACLPAMSSLTKLTSEPPLWFINVDDHRIELTTEELQNPRLFQKKCMDSISIMPPIVKMDVWQETVNRLMEDVIEIEQPKETSLSGTFEELMQDYCNNKAVGTLPTDLLRGRPYRKDGVVYFKLSDLITFLKRKDFTSYSKVQVSQKIKEMGGDSEAKVYINRAQVRVYSIPAFEELPECDVPEVEVLPI